jgi:hypothetical protein
LVQETGDSLEQGVGDMHRNTLGALAVAALVVTGGITAGAALLPRAGVDGKAAFELMKTLEGTWTATAADGSKATTRFELTGNGTVLIEHYSNSALPGGGHMMTAYHLDGTDLLLTHYCMANNQPTLKADSFNSATGDLQFEFVRVTNLPSPSAGHMRRAHYRIKDRHHFTTEWEFFKEGRKTMTETEAFRRVK